jgi:cytochrome c biogenesis factor
MTEPYGQYPAQQPYGQPYPLVPREHPQGTAVLVLGILGVFVAGICAPFAWYMGSKALKEIRATGVHYSNEQSIVVGRVLGMIMTILAIVGIVFLLVFLVIVLVSASVGGS